MSQNFEKEPKPQPLEGENFHNKTTTTEDDARLDIKANGLWGGRFSRTFFDVKIVNPHAKICHKTRSDAQKNHECQNIRIPTKNSKCRTQQLCTTNFCVYWRRSIRLYKNRPETSRESKRKTEQIRRLWRQYTLTLSGSARKKGISFHNLAINPPPSTKS